MVSPVKKSTSVIAKVMRDVHRYATRQEKVSSVCVKKDSNSLRTERHAKKCTHAIRKTKQDANKCATKKETKLSVLVNRKKTSN
jgi:hypothetical protein